MATLTLTCIIGDLVSAAGFVLLKGGWVV